MMTTNGRKYYCYLFLNEVEQSMMFGEPIWVVVTAIQNPNSTIQAGWGGFGSVPFGGGGQVCFSLRNSLTRQQQPDNDMTMG
jgi:hypothetical protein